MAHRKPCRKDFQFQVVITDRVEDETNFFLLMRSSDFWREVKKHMGILDVKYKKVNFYEYKSLNCALNFGYTQLIIEREMKGFISNSKTANKLLFKILENDLLLKILVEKSGDAKLQSDIMNELIRRDYLISVVKMLSSGYCIGSGNYKTAVIRGSLEMVKTLFEWKPPNPNCIEYEIDKLLETDGAVLYYIVERYPSLFTRENIKTAAKHGRYSIIKRVHSQDLFTVESCVLAGDERVFQIAKSDTMFVKLPLKSILENHGKVEIIRKAEELGMLFRGGDFNEDSVLSIAASKGYLDVVKFLHTKMKSKCSEQDLITAVTNNDVNMVEYMIGIMGCNKDDKLSYIAIKSGCGLEMLEFLHSKNLLKMNEEVLRLARLHSGRDVVEYFEMLQNIFETPELEFQNYHEINDFDDVCELLEEDYYKSDDSPELY